MSAEKTLEVPIKGMDCAECSLHVQHAIAELPGVESVDVFLTSEKAVVHLDPALVDVPAIRKAVEGAGYSVPEAQDETAPATGYTKFTRSVLTLLGVVFGAVLFVVVVGEWLGLFEALTARVPFLVGLAIVLVAGFPVFRNVIRAALKGQVIAHTLMSLGVIAALAVGEWATAAVVVFFMRVGDYAEHFTTERARRAVKDLTALAPQTARVERDGREVEVPVSQVKIGETVIVRPGEKIPVDGEVLSGQATIDQATITGESLPVDAGPGARVYAATLAQLGSLRIQATQVGADTTFGKVIKLVEEAEAHRADVQRVADKFSAYYLPVVAGVAALTYLLRRDPLATAAVLVVACSCSFALATPIAVLASIGAGARRGLMIKGGKYLELLAQADVLLIDKTGTLTLGKPQITDVVVLNGVLQANNGSSESTLLRYAASAERYSEHPLAEAVRSAARQRSLNLVEALDFKALPGSGVQARIDGRTVEVGSRRLLGSRQPDQELVQTDGDQMNRIDSIALLKRADELESQGKTVLFVALEGSLVGLLAAADTLRPEVPQAIQAVRGLGVHTVELLTGDNPATAAALVKSLGADNGVLQRANLLPEDKIKIVKEYQAQGHTVIMVGDGVNDAPALAQADVGIAMGAAGSDVAIEAAHVALMREDWNLVPQLLHISRRTLRVVKMNIAFTAIYNIAGLSLAALGFLPPIFAAAAQSLPDLGILANSSRLIRQ
jgi:P-type Cu+ transporter